MDWLGAIVLASVVAIGGGTIRDLLIGHLPVSWVEDAWPVQVAIGTAIVVILILRIRPNIDLAAWTPNLVADAAGLSAFVILGTDGTVSSYDYDDHVTVQTRKKTVPHQIPAPAPKAPNQNPVQDLLHCLDKGVPLEGPVSLPISRIGQEIVDAAVKSAKLKKAVKLE